MSAPTDSTPHSTEQSTNDPIAVLHFKYYTFSAVTYNTIGCTVLYNQRYQVDDRPDKLAGPPHDAQYRDRYEGGEGIYQPPGIVVVKWKSLDGVPHEADVDLGKIFPDRRALHRVHDSEIPDGWVRDDVGPGIILEVDDRTIRVFMRTHVGTKNEQIPGNKYSSFKADLIEAWKKSY